MNIQIRQYNSNDVHQTMNIWNEVVMEGIAFPQSETLDEITADEEVIILVNCSYMTASRKQKNTTTASFSSMQ